MTNTTMQTAGGGRFDLGDPRVEDVNWEDVANALSRVCRFNGHIPLETETYSVAQHCCHVADLLPTALQFLGLLHDAHEAYTGDWISPLKQTFLMMGAGPITTGVERHVESVVHAAAGVEAPRQGPIANEIKHADMVALATERRDLLAESDVEWGRLPGAMFPHITPWPRLRAYEEWMDRFNTLHQG